MSPPDKPITSMLNPRADPERFIRECVCVWGGGGGESNHTFFCYSRGGPFEEFLCFPWNKQLDPRRGSLFIPWKTGKQKISSRALAFPMGMGLVRGRLIPMETYRALVIFQGDSDPMCPLLIRPQKHRCFFSLHRKAIIIRYTLTIIANLIKMYYIAICKSNYSSIEKLFFLMYS